METTRFETFFDAIIAIIITILVLKISQPASPTLGAVLELQTYYVAYFISFLILYNIWYFNHNLFHLIDNIDNTTLLIYGTMTFVISLIPYFTIWLARDIYSIPAETMFGLIFITTHILSILANYTIMKSNPYSKIQEIQYSSILNNIPAIIIIIGFILTYTVYTPGIYVACLISVILWIIIGRLTRRCNNGE